MRRSVPNIVGSTKWILLWPGRHQWLSIPLLILSGIRWITFVDSRNYLALASGFIWVILVGWFAAAIRIVDPHQPLLGTMIVDLKSTGKTIYTFYLKHPTLSKRLIWFAVGLACLTPMRIGPWSGSTTSVFPLVIWIVISFFHLT